MSLADAASRRVIVTGCSGGGKSTLVAELARRGYATIEEPGRRIVREELVRGGSALPWVDAEAFLRRAIEVSRRDLAAAAGEPGWLFIDRGLVDACAALTAVTGRDAFHLAAGQSFHRLVFLAPPWPEIYETDAERRHGLEEALGEYERNLKDYPALGFEIVLLPKTPVDERADFVLARLSSA